MNAAAYQNCPDFSTATGLPAAGSITEAAWKAADELGLSDTGSRRFSQGYIHAAQGRTDLTGTCPDYDAGHAAYRRTCTT